MHADGHVAVADYLLANPAHQPGKLQRFLGADDVAVHDVERIAHLRHVQLGQRPPRQCSVDGSGYIERAELVLLILALAQERRVLQSSLGL